MGADALIPDHSVHEVVDFEYVIRSGPGQLHGGGTLDTDRLIFARRAGIGRETKGESAGYGIGLCRPTDGALRTRAGLKPAPTTESKREIDSG